MALISSIPENGPNFLNKQTNFLNHIIIFLIQIGKTVSQCYFVELNNKTGGQAIRTYIMQHRDWDNELSKIQFAINTAIHEVHDLPPVFINFTGHTAALGKYYCQNLKTKNLEFCFSDTYR